MTIKDVERQGISNEVWEQNYKSPSDESLDDTWDRQAKACASVEDKAVRQQVYEDFKWLLTDFKGIAGGRITANLGVEGREATTLMNCFLPGTKVLTVNGYVSIENICVGDKVLTHTGNWQSVHNTLSRYYEGEVDSYKSSLLNNTVVCTTNHEFYQGNNEWTKSHNNKILALPFVEDCGEYFTIDIQSYLDENIIHNKLGTYLVQIKNDDDKVWHEKDFIGGNGARGTKSSVPINKKFRLDEDAAYLFGRFIGDGSVYSTQGNEVINGVNIVFSDLEKDHMKKCNSIIENTFGISFNENMGDSFHYLRKANIVLASFFASVCGIGVDKKRVPSFIMESKESVRKSFLLGLLDSDGMVGKNGVIKLTLSNESLIDDVKFLFNSIGLIPRKNAAYVSHVENAKPAWVLQVSASQSQSIFSDLLKVYADDRLSQSFGSKNKFHKYGKNFISSDFEKSTYSYKGMVYNISVNKDESYVVEGVVVHNCFVHNPADIGYADSDSIHGIYKMLECQAQTLKSEGGYGMNFSWIRPNGSYVSGIDSRTPGVINFMGLWDRSSEIITMGSEKILGGKRPNEKRKIRKGAQMGILDVWHPEIEEFIEAKLVEGRLSKFNISVGITEGFMDAVVSDGTWDLRFPDTECKEYKKLWFGNIYDWESKGLPVIVHKTLRARDLWAKITKSTYARNDPGVLFFDHINKMNPLQYAERIATTNPCGEISMSTGVCLLFSLNLVKFIKKGKDRFVFDFETFKKAVSVATRFADNINDISRVPIDAYKKSMQEKRRLGIGVLSLGSLHYCLGIRFGSAESQQLISDIFKVKAETEILTSAELGVEKGSFKLFDKEKYFGSHWWKNLPISKSVKKRVEEMGEMRNSHRAANAPTGNMSIYAGVVSGGIEPVFMKEYARWAIVPEQDRIVLREAGFEFPNIFAGEWFETKQLKTSKAGTDDILVGKFNGTDYMVDKNRGLTKRTVVMDWGWAFVQANYTEEEIAKMESEKVFVTTEDLSVDEHLKTLEIIAPFVDQNSSKTINVPNDYSYEQFENVYLDAWKVGIKGITTYRAGTMTAVLEAVDKPEPSVGKASAPKRPKELPCELHRPKIKGKEWAVVVGLYNGTPYEVFSGPIEGIDFPQKGFGQLVKKKKGVYSLIMPDMEIENIVDYLNDEDSAWATRMISMSLRHGIPLEFIYDQLSKDGNIVDANKVLARILKKYINLSGKPKCPQCGSESVVLEEGCMRCLECNFGKCG